MPYNFFFRVKTVDLDLQYFYCARNPIKQEGRIANIIAKISVLLNLIDREMACIQIAHLWKYNNNVYVERRYLFIQ